MPPPVQQGLEARLADHKHGEISTPNDPRPDLWSKAILSHRHEQISSELQKLDVQRGKQTMMAPVSIPEKA